MALLEGSLERITYHNPDTGYTVARVQPAGKRHLVAVVGKLLGGLAALPLLATTARRISVMRRSDGRELVLTAFSTRPMASCSDLLDTGEFLSTFCWGKFIAMLLYALAGERAT